MKKYSKIFRIVMLTFMMTILSVAIKVNANAAADYPVQEVQITNSNGYNLSLKKSKLIGTNDVKSEGSFWKLTYVKGGYYKINNTSTGKLLTPFRWDPVEGIGCIVHPDANRQEQCWNIQGVDKDFLGNYITYKITNYNNPNMAVTYVSNDNITLSQYKGTENQKWRINSAGLEGFAGYSKDMKGNYKASDIGGVLGETVHVGSVSDLMKYAKGDTPRTIVVDNSLSVNVPSDYQHKDSDEKKLTKIVVGKNKTIIGAYGVSLNNIYFYLDQTSNSGNFIIKNFTIKHDEQLNLNNFIPMYISQGQNFWIDHCTFEGHNMNNNTSLHEHDVDKFLYVGVKADYVTLSYSKFGDHKYGLILGYPSDDNSVKSTYTGYPRMTISDNYFKSMTCRAPGLMRYGYFHSFNNYVENVHLGYTACTNATILSQNNYFNNVKGIVDDYGTAKFTDEGSYPNVTASKSPATSWRAQSNYNYSLKPASAMQDYCKNYSGAQNSKDNFTYSTTKIGVNSSNYVVTE